MYGVSALIVRLMLQCFHQPLCCCSCTFCLYANASTGCLYATPLVKNPPHASVYPPMCSQQSLLTVGGYQQELVDSGALQCSSLTFPGQQESAGKKHASRFTIASPRERETILRGLHKACFCEIALFCSRPCSESAPHLTLASMGEL